MTTNGYSLVQHSNLAIPPGAMLTEEMEYRAMPRDFLAGKLGQPEAFIAKIITGEQAITPEIAEVLAAAFWIPAWYWLKLEARYRATLARTAANQTDQGASAAAPAKVDIAAD